MEVNYGFSGDTSAKRRYHEDLDGGLCGPGVAGHSTKDAIIGQGTSYSIRSITVVRSQTTSHRVSEEATGRNNSGRVQLALLARTEGGVDGRRQESIGVGIEECNGFEPREGNSIERSGAQLAADQHRSYRLVELPLWTESTVSAHSSTSAPLQANHVDVLAFEWKRVWICASLAPRAYAT